MSGTEVTKQEPQQDPIKIIRREVTGMESQFKAALPAHVPPERFIRIAMTAISTRKDLLNCRKEDVYAELMKCAQDGLVPDGREATVVVYNVKGTPTPKYMPMVGGICKKARNSGDIKTMNAHVVYENDNYRSWADETGEHFIFERAEGDRGKVRLTFAFALTKDGGLFFEEVSEAQMDAIERCSRGKDGPWKGDFKDEMRRKSALRRLAKYRLPSSTDLDDLIRRDDDMYTFDAPTVTAASSQAALAARVSEQDFLPGVKPPVTAKAFVAKLKDVKGGRHAIQRQYEIYSEENSDEAASKLFDAAKEHGIDLTKPISLSPGLGSDDDMAAALADTEAANKGGK